MLEAQSTVVKTVAKLVGPSVVHIEADVPADAEPQYGHDRHVEEAGSGVIIQRKGRFYVLTNRHVFRNAAPRPIRIHLADGRLHPPDEGSGRRRHRRGRAGHRGARSGRRAGRRQRSDGDRRLRAGRRSPFGLSQSVTFGIISAQGRPIFTWATPRSASRTSCRPTPRSIPATAAGRW